jgi:hypothetical protein
LNIDYLTITSDKTLVKVVPTAIAVNHLFAIMRRARMWRSWARNRAVASTSDNIELSFTTVINPNHIAIESPAITFTAIGMGELP